MRRASNLGLVLVAAAAASAAWEAGLLVWPLDSSVNCLLVDCEPYISMMLVPVLVIPFVVGLRVGLIQPLRMSHSIALGSCTSGVAGLTAALIGFFQIPSSDPDRTFTVGGLVVALVIFGTALASALAWLGSHLSHNLRHRRAASSSFET